MKTKKQVIEMINVIEKDYSHVLEGTTATLPVNPLRALLQVSTIAKLIVLHQVIGKEYKSKLKGFD